MTAFPGAGTALDRVGGRAVFEAKVRDVFRPGRILEVGVADSPRFYYLELLDGDGRVIAELRSVEIARSSALRDDQLRLLRADMAALAPALAAFLLVLEDEAIPPLERRAMEGDR